jgi:hypothetical protein
MSNQIEKDKNKLLSFAEIFDGDNEYQSACDDIHDIAARLGKLDGWNMPAPSASDKKAGWDLSYDFLQNVKHRVDVSIGEIVSLEIIEQILLHAEKLSEPTIPDDWGK